jgi:uncharacterized protein (DUF58 family)
MKLSKEILHKVKQIEILTRRLLRGSLIGEHRSSRKGSGLEFDQIRDYQMGDDIRFIDWKTSARLGTLSVKEYIEERNRTIMLLVDVSASTFYGSGDFLKSEIIAQIASVLAVITESAKDYCGAILFNDEIVKVIPPSQGRAHTHRMMEEFFLIQPHGKTDFTKACNKLLSLQKKDTIVFILSDFLEQNNYEKALNIMARHHDVIAVHCVDPQEEKITFAGQIIFEDSETKSQIVVDGSDDFYKKASDKKIENIQMLFKKSGIDFLKVESGHDFVGNIIRFFRKRMRS